MTDPFTPTSKPDSDERLGGHQVCVVGAGYVGLTAAACLAHLGHNVTCVEASPHRLEVLRGGGIPIHEPGLADLVDEGVRNGRLRWAADVASGLGDAGIVLLCVGTPPRADGEPDLSQLADAGRQVARAASRDLVVVVKSTVPPGSCEAIELICADEAGAGVTIRVASSPEFLRESRAVEDFLFPDRVVVGAEDLDVIDLVASLYPPASPVVRCDRRGAELVKYAANTFLAIKISFANEVAQLCDALGTNAMDVLDGVGSDSRIGRQFLKPGPGYGGSCLPKDVSGFVALGKSAGTWTSLACAAEEQNAHARRSVAGRLELVIGPLRGKRIGLLGLAFKDGTDDVRDSPSMQIAKDLLAAGAVVCAYDPLAHGESAPVEVKRVTSPREVLTGAEAVVIGVDSPEYRNLDPIGVADLMSGDVVFDAAGVCDLDAWGRAGLNVYGVGRGTPMAFYPVVWAPLRWTVGAPVDSLD